MKSLRGIIIHNFSYQMKQIFSQEIIGTNLKQTGGTFHVAKKVLLNSLIFMGNYGGLNHK